jgi:hypothetical protein
MPDNRYLDPFQFNEGPTGAQTASGNSSDFNADSLEATWFLNVSASSGTTPTLDVKLQMKNLATGTYIDVSGASFAQKTGVSHDSLTLALGAGAVANRVVAQPVPPVYRWAWTIGGTTPSFTFSLNRHPINLY